MSVADMCIADPDGMVDWDGMKGYFIHRKYSTTKQKSPLIDHDVKPSEEVQSKNKVNSAAEATSQVLPLNVCLDCNEANYQVASYFTELVKSFIHWGKLKFFLSADADVYDKLEKDVFSSIAKAVLTIFDQEDFASIWACSKRRERYEKLWKKFKARPCERGSSEDRYLAIREARKGCILALAKEENPETFNGLVERDFAFLIERAIDSTSFDYEGLFSSGYAVESVMRFIREGKVSKECRLLEDIRSQETQRIRKVKTVPLKEHYKAQLTLELADQRWYYVMDYLFVEACNGIMSEELLSELLKALDKGIGIEGYDDDEMEAEELLVDEFFGPLRQGLFELGFVKQRLDEMSVFCARLTFDGIEGPFGKSSKDVRKVMKFADYERRYRGHRFIGLDDVLFGLSLSKLAHHPLVQGAISDTSAADVDTSPGIPPYKIYQLAKDCATHFESKLVELEHLVLAVIFEVRNRKQEAMIGWSREDLESLVKMKKNDPFGGKDWMEPGLSIQSEKGYLSNCRELVEALKKGPIELPEIRDANGCGLRPSSPFLVH